MAFSVFYITYVKNALTGLLSLLTIRIQTGLGRRGLGGSRTSAPIRVIYLKREPLAKLFIPIISLPALWQTLINLTGGTDASKDI